MIIKYNHLRKFQQGKKKHSLVFMCLANPSRPLDTSSTIIFPSFFIAIATWKWSMFSSLHFHFQLNSTKINNHYKLVKNMSLIKKNFLFRAYALPFLWLVCWYCTSDDADGAFLNLKFVFQCQDQETTQYVPCHCWSLDGLDSSS